MKQYEQVARRIQDLVDDGYYVDLAPGNERYIGVTRTVFVKAVNKLLSQHEYKIMFVRTKSNGNVLLIAPSTTTKDDVIHNLGKITLLI